MSEDLARGMSVRVGDQETRAAREADWVGIGWFVRGENARDSGRRQQRPGEFCVRPGVEPADLDHRLPAYVTVDASLTEKSHACWE
jgi:hypothetical protein